MKRPNREIKQDFDILHSKALFKENMEKYLKLLTFCKKQSVKTLKCM